MQRKNLPYHALPLSGGFSTQINERDVWKAYLRDARNVDRFGLFSGIRKVPGTEEFVDIAGGIGTGVVALPPFFVRGQTSDASQVERILVPNFSSTDSEFQVFSRGADTTYPADLNPANIGFLGGGTTSGTARIGSGRAVVDGATVYFPWPGYDIPLKVVLNSDDDGPGRGWRWGVEAPGQSVAELSSFDNFVGISVTNSAATVTARSDSAPNNRPPDRVYKDRDLLLDKTSATSPLTIRDTTTLTVDISTSASGVFWVYIPEPLYDGFADAVAVSLTLFTSGFVNGDQWDFPKSDLLPGWNALTFDTSAGANVGAGMTPSTITDIEVSFYTTDTGKSLALSAITFHETGTPTVSVGAAGALTGVWSYKVTFVTRFGLESNAGPSSATVNTTATDPALSAVPISPDNQVVARRIYRDSGGSGVYQFVGEILDNTTTTYVDSLVTPGTATPPEAGDANVDNSPPPVFRDAVEYKGVIIGVQNRRQYRLYISDSNKEVFPLLRITDLPEEIVAMQVLGSRVDDGVLLCGKTNLYLLEGDSYPFTIRKVNSSIGSGGERSITSVQGNAVVLSEAGPYLMNDLDSPWHLAPQVRDVFEAVLEKERSFVFHDLRRQRVLFFLDEDDPIVANPASFTPTRCMVYDYGKQGAGKPDADRAIEPTDFRVGVWYEIDKDWVNDHPFAVGLIEEGRQEKIIALGQDATWYTWQDSTNYTWEDESSPVVMTLETHEMPISKGPDGTGRPRYVFIDGTFNAGSTLDFTWTASSGPGSEELQTTTWTHTFAAAGDQTARINVPRSVRRSGWGRLKIVNDEAVPVELRDVRLYYIPERSNTGEGI